LRYPTRSGPTQRHPRNLAKDISRLYRERPLKRQEFIFKLQ